MKSIKKLGLALCAALAVAVFTGAITENAQAATKSYVSSISSVKVNGTKVKNGGTYSLYLGSKTPTVKTSVSLSVKGKPSKKVTYATNSKSIATISSSGTITPKKAGTATIKVTTVGKNKSGKKISYMFKVKVYSTALTASSSAKSLEVGQSATLNISKYSSLSSISVTSSDKSILTVTKKSTAQYTLKGIKAGTAKVTITGTSAGNKATRTTSLTLTVSKVSDSYTLTTASTLPAVSISGIAITAGNVSDFFNKDMAAVASQVLTSDKDITISWAENGVTTTYTASYNSVSKEMEYTKDGESATITNATFEGKSLSDVTVTFPNGVDLTSMIGALQTSTYASTSSYGVTFAAAYNGETYNISLSEIHISNGSVYFTTGGASFKAYIGTDGKTLVVENTSTTSAVSFSSTTLSKLLDAMGIY